MTSPKERLFPNHNAGDSAYLAWAALGSAHAVELAGKAGADAVLIDTQHGIAGKSELVSCLTAARAASLPALVRVLEKDAGLIGQALDAGARGVLCPMINTPADAQSIVEAAKYPPLGSRSYGPYAGRLLRDGDYFEGANNWSIVGAQIETKEALGNLDAILATEGLDMVLVGPNDLAISLSDGKTRNIREAAVLDAIDHILDACRKHGVLSAIFANDVEYAQPLVKSGWDLIAVGTDAGLLSAAMQECIEKVKQP